MYSCYMGWHKVEHCSVACTLVLVYMSTRLEETVSEFRSIGRLSTMDREQHSTIPIQATMVLKLYVCLPSHRWRNYRITRHLWLKQKLAGNELKDG